MENYVRYAYSKVYYIELKTTRTLLNIAIISSISNKTYNNNVTISITSI